MSGYMKVVIINKSDATGGAAVVSRRLMEALKENGVDARMLVCEKTTNSPYIELASTPKKIRRKFLKERLKIFIANGFSRKTLFKIDTGKVGLPLWKNQLIKEADAILINWINQGMLSLRGEKRLLKLGKPIIWTMHDMWNMTGICHHAGKCDRFMEECGDCPLLGWKSSVHDISYKCWKRKNKLYSRKNFMCKTAFVCVSRWLKDRAMESSLLKSHKVCIIPNAFKINDEGIHIREIGGKVRILFGAARLDDPVKGLSTLKIMTSILSEEYPEIASNLELALFGDIKKQSALKNFAIPVISLGILKGDEAVANTFRDADIVVSASSYETLPGTMVEAQAYGCIPVCFRRGGQPDIIEQLSTGYMAEYDSDIYDRAKNLAQGVIWAYTIVKDEEKLRNIRWKMRKNVEQKFSYKKIATQYISLIDSLSGSNHK